MGLLPPQPALQPQVLGPGGHSPGPAEQPPHPQLLQRSRQGCVPRPLTSLPTTIYPSRESEATLSPEMRLAWPHRAHLVTPSVLVQDEGHLGAVHLRRQPLAGAHVEHGQRGQWPGHLPTGCHLPQLLCVPADGAVVDHLDAGGTGPTESSALAPCAPASETRCSPPLAGMRRGRTNRRVFGAGSGSSDRGIGCGSRQSGFKAVCPWQGAEPRCASVSSTVKWA